MKTSMKKYKGINITPYSERRALIVEETKNDIKALKAMGLTFQQIGDLMDMTRTGVNNFLKDYNRKK